jgi:diaminopimelate decarboxylase
MVSGLHCHYPSRDIESFRLRTRALLQVCDTVWNGPPEFLNFGGGFAGSMPAELRAQFSYPIPSYAEYAACVGRAVAAHFGGSAGRQPQLFIEPGTSVVANCLSFVTTITAVKHVRSKRIAIASGSVFNTSPTAKQIALPVRVVARRRNETRRKQTDIVGYTCIEGDYLARGIRHELAVGDFVIIDNVGSYSIVMKPPFILPNAPVIRLGRRASTYHLIKRAEQSADVFQTFTDVKPVKRR